MLITAFAVLGLLGIVAAAFAARANKRRADAGAIGGTWRQFWRWRWLVGTALGIASYFISYPLAHEGETWRVLGFPFFAAAFDPGGADYVGPTTLPAVFLNFLFFLLLPQLELWAAGQRRKSA